MLKSCGFPHPCVDNLRNGARHEPRNHAHASCIAGTEPPRLAQHPPCPFEAGSACNGRRAVLRAGDEIERGADAQHAGSVQLVEAARREQFLPWRAERDEAEFRAGGANAFDRSVGFAGIGIEVRSRRKAPCNLQSLEIVPTDAAPSSLSVRSFEPSRKTGSCFLPRFRADRFDKIGAGRALDPRAQQPAQHDDREAIGRDKSGTAIGGAKVGMLLQLNNMIEIERADAEVVATLRGRHDR